MSHATPPRRPAGLPLLAAATLLASSPAPARAQAAPAAVEGVAAPQRDGRHDFDFLLGDWKVHLKRLPDRLVGSTAWIEYDGTARIRRFLDSSANLEEFDVASPAAGLHIKAQTLRLYNPASRQWSLYLLDVDNGQLPMPATVGGFKDGRGEFFDMEDYRGRMVLVRYVWTHDAPGTALMEQSFSADGGKTWEVNWICAMTRTGA